MSLCDGYTKAKARELAIMRGTLPLFVRAHHREEFWRTAGEEAVRVEMEARLGVWLRRKLKQRAAYVETHLAVDRLLWQL